MANEIFNMENEEEVKGYFTGGKVKERPTFDDPRVGRDIKQVVPTFDDPRVGKDIERVEPTFDDPRVGKEPTLDDPRVDPTYITDKEGTNKNVDTFFNNTSMATQRILTEAKHVNRPKIDYTDAENKVSKLPYPWNTLRPEVLSSINDSISSKTDGSYGANDVVNSLFEISENDKPLAQHNFGDSLAVFDNILTTQIRDMVNVSDTVKVNRAAREYVKPMQEVFKKFAQGMGDAVNPNVLSPGGTGPMDFDAEFTNEYGFLPNAMDDEPNIHKGVNTITSDTNAIINSQSITRDDKGLVNWLEDKIFNTETVKEIDEQSEEIIDLLRYAHDGILSDLSAEHIDALRHYYGSSWTSETAGPFLSFAAGIYHEATAGQGGIEDVKDLINNVKGILGSNNKNYPTEEFISLLTLANSGEANEKDLNRLDEFINHALDRTVDVDESSLLGITGSR